MANKKKIEKQTEIEQRTKKIPKLIYLFIILLQL